MRSTLALLCIGLCFVLLSACATRGEYRPLDPVVGAGGPISWNVVNRFRLIDRSDEARFYGDLARFTDEHSAWAARERGFNLLPNFRPTDLLGRPRLPFVNANDNYVTAYDAVREYRYAPAWVADRARTLRFIYQPSSSALPASARCEWTVNNGAPQLGPCADFEAEGTIDEPLRIAVRYGDGASEGIVVTPRDITIVALGDSFSAGEGNPHSQWRVLTAQPQAAEWLDARCHRSLMSGPSIAAAYVALHNPHLSVTLLHYGCSGASVADGVVGPWAYLESSEVVDRRYAFYDALWGADVAVRPQPLGAADIGRSQVSQAQADLQGRQPDIVLVTTGGNDIGFARIVSAFVSPWVASPDLALGPSRDVRRVAPYDQGDWRSLPEPPVCLGERSRAAYLACVQQRVEARVARLISDHRGGPLGQYTRLDRALEPMVDSNRVFITQYPSLMTRAERGDNGDVIGEYIACADRPFDNRPGLVPGIFSLIPNIGVREDAARIAYDGIVRPLNEAIDEAGRQHGWHVVREHVGPSRAMGLCSYERYFNTLVDSAILQGVFSQRPRYVGVLQVMEQGFHADLQPGDAIVWDANSVAPSGAQGCYRRADVVYAPEGDCLLINGGYEPIRELDPERGTVVRRGPLGTSGVVHPTLFGHCAIAAAMLANIARERGDEVYLQPDFIEAVTEYGFGPEQLCRSAAWGQNLDQRTALDGPP